MSNFCRCTKAEGLLGGTCASCQKKISIGSKVFRDKSDTRVPDLSPLIPQSHTETHKEILEVDNVQSIPKKGRELANRLRIMDSLEVKNRQTGRTTRILLEVALRIVDPENCGRTIYFFAAYSEYGRVLFRRLQRLIQVLDVELSSIDRTSFVLAGSGTEVCLVSREEGDRTIARLTHPSHIPSKGDPLVFFDHYQP